MSNGFQFYEGSTTEGATTPKITVRRGGVLVLSSAAVAMLGDGVTHVQIAYNAESKAIGLRGATEDCKGRYRLRTQRNSVSRLVDGKRVFKLHGLTAEKSRSFDVEDFGDGVIGFRMNDVGVGAGEADVGQPATQPVPAKTKRRKSAK